MRRSLYTTEHEEFRSGFRAFLDREAVPHVEAWEAAGFVDRKFTKLAGENGFLAFEAPAEFGGLGIEDFRYNSVIAEEIVASGTAGDTFVMHNDIIAPYLIELTNQRQKERWLPGFTGGDTVAALALTEPGAGSDLSAIRTTARREAETLVLDGSKTFITNGASCELAIVLARTGERDGRGTSLVVVEHGTPGFHRGKPMKKIGRKAQDTAELFFTDCRVPVENIIGEPGRGFSETMKNLPRERLAIAMLAVASAERALRLTLRYTSERAAFGATLNQLPAVRNKLAELHTNTTIGRVYLDKCIAALIDGELSAEEAAAAKYWTTDLQCQVIDDCLQLFGGYGYMEEYAIAGMWRDARVQRIYGGANEVMKDIIGRALTKVV